MEEKKNDKSYEKLKKELKEEVLKEIAEEKKEDKKFEEKAKETIDKIMDTEDNTKDYEKKDIDSNKGLAMISYLGPLSLIPFLVSKDSKFVQYHAKQGLNLFIVEMLIAIFSYFLTTIIQFTKMCNFGGVSYECGVYTPWWLTFPISLLEALTFILAIVGLVYACQGKAKEIPILGKLKIIK